MKNTAFKHALIFTLTLTSCIQNERTVSDVTSQPIEIYRSTEVGNGGHGLRIGEKVVMLDLFEAGLHDGPSDLSCNVELSEDIAQILTESLKLLGNNGHISKIIQCINLKHPLAALEIIYAIRQLTWFLVDADLKVTNDLGDSPVDVPHPIVQVAVRIGSSVRIDRKKFALMDEWNKAALILHEAVFAYATKQMSSGPVRDVIGKAFSAQGVSNLLPRFLQYTEARFLYVDWKKPWAGHEIRFDESSRMENSDFVSIDRVFSRTYSHYEVPGKNYVLMERPELWDLVVGRDSIKFFYQPNFFGAFKLAIVSGKIAPDLVIERACEEFWRAGGEQVLPLSAWRSPGKMFKFVWREEASGWSFFVPVMASEFGFPVAFSNDESSKCFDALKSRLLRTTMISEGI
jgi:hypothetical protein